MYVTVLKIDTGIPCLTDSDSQILISLKIPVKARWNACTSGILGGRGFDPPVWLHSFVEMGHEINSTAIISLPLIQVGRLSVTGKGWAHNTG